MAKLSIVDSKAIDWLRFPLIYLVVVIHSALFYDKLIPIHWDAMTGQDYYQLLVIFFSRSGAQIAVPTFFVISGYLFFFKVNEWSKKVYVEKLKSRIHTLLIPYLLWIIIYIVLTGGYLFFKAWIGRIEWEDVSEWYNNNNGLLGMFWLSNEWGWDRLNLSGFPTPMGGPIAGPLWYIRNLMVLVILTPLIYIAIKRLKKWWLFFLAALYLGGVYLYIPGLRETDLLFFSIGAYLGVNKLSFTVLYKYRFILYPMSIALWILYAIAGGYDTILGRSIDPFYVLSGTLSIICIALQIVGGGTC